MVRFGILGTARIAEAFLREKPETACITAIASRDGNRAREFARRAGLTSWFGSYEDLLADPAIDAVYIPLPPAMHCEYTVKALEAGKHVLVEKPAGLTVGEVERMQAAARAAGVRVMECLMYRFLRVHRRALEILREGTIGKLQAVDFRWASNLDLLARSPFRLDPAQGGGAMYDLGIYGIDFLRLVTGGEPRVLHAAQRRRGDAGVDDLVMATLSVNDVIATIGCGFRMDANYYLLAGETGSITSPIALSGRYSPRELHIHQLGEDRRWVEQFEPENPYSAGLEYFASCIVQAVGPQPGLDNAARNLSLLTRILSVAEELD